MQQTEPRKVSPVFRIWKVVKYKPEQRRRRRCNIKGWTYVIPGKTLHRKKVLPPSVLLGKKLRVETQLWPDAETKYWPEEKSFLVSF
jgi:hypothetical protein